MCVIFLSSPALLSAGGAAYPVPRGATRAHHSHAAVTRRDFTLRAVQPGVAIWHITQPGPRRASHVNKATGHGNVAVRPCHRARAGRSSEVIFQWHRARERILFGTW